MRNKGLLEDFRRAIPDFSAEDNVGSPSEIPGNSGDIKLLLVV
ncbi:MAG: hypothetical protein ABSE63_01300 [Thermoguttaceae bacterium]